MIALGGMARRGQMRRFDAIVIGGGLVGTAIGYGLARAGLGVALLDEGDIAYRASRGNFGLVWVQTKGIGAPHYQRWTRRSAKEWPALAAELGNFCFEYRMLDHAELAAMLPGLGPSVVGASWTPYDGHANSLALFHALHKGFAAAGGTNLPNATVTQADVAPRD